MTGQWKNRKIQSRADAAELFLEMIRPLKKYYSDGKGWLHVGNTGVHLSLIHISEPTRP